MKWPMFYPKKYRKNNHDELIKVRYMGSWADYSGYGEANRNAIRALMSVNVKVTTQKVVNVRERANFGKIYNEIAALEGKPLDYRIKIIHITPDGYLKYLEPMKYHIGHLFWETSSLPPSWVWNANLMNEIWTGDKYHAKVFQDSGVRVPIFVIPQAIDTEFVRPKPFTIAERPRFLFYSIFQWIERKNPQLLLEAYWQEFSPQEDVGLLLKTYRLDFSSNEKQKIYSDIKKWKAGRVTAPIFLYDDLLSRDNMYRLHATGDCFVLPHRGEGWGVTQVEASLMGNPVISTDLGGMHDWMDDSTMLLLKDYKLVNVFNMDFVPWYTSNQLWAEPSLTELRQKMRWAYENYGKAKEMAERARQRVLKNFSFQAVGDVMADRLGYVIFNELPKKR
jgi:glycosyltransferase involved in cell wall biosynthesis